MEPVELAPLLSRVCVGKPQEDVADVALDVSRVDVP